MIINLIQDTVRRAPDEIAVLSRGGALTYRDLWHRAGQVTQKLNGLLAGHRAPIGVLAGPSVDGIVGVLASLRAGAPYVGACPSLPRARIDAMMRDSGVQFVLHGRDVPPDMVTQGAPIDIRATEAECPDADSPLPVMHPEAPAAVIYTSGSTGAPKGVMIPQRALLNRLEWGQRTYRLGRGERVLHHTRYIYDFSAWEVLAPLAYGAALVVESFRNYPDFEEIAGAIQSFKVTTAHFVPSVLAGLVRRDSFRECASLVTVFSGGEALSRRLAAEFGEACGATLYNQYGPTETCVDSSCFRCAGGDPVGEQAPDTVSIGTPIDGTRFYVLDSSLRPVPEGATGELYIGGLGVATGYLGRPGLTAERFVPDPFGGNGERVYRTGDLVRSLAGGLTQFVGRTDWQIKLRGVRLEPGEIETALESHPDVMRAVVTVTAEPEPHLVAWIVPEPGSPVTRDELRRLARDVLPPAAVPDRLFIGESLPLLANGKTDRRAVQNLIEQAGGLPGAAGNDGRRGEAGPAVPQELAAIWTEVLGVGEIDPDGDFFELGGHSLLAAELVTVINERLSAEIPLADFFETPTLSRTAELLKMTSANGAGRRGF